MPVSNRRVAWIVLTLSLGAVVAEHSHAGHETRFAERIRTLSGPGGVFDTDNLISNEASYLDVMPALVDRGVTVSGMPRYPDITRDYAGTFIAQKETKIDVWLASHASQFRMHEKYKPGDPYTPDRFVDPNGFLDSVRRLEKIYLDQLARERAAK